MYTTHHIHNTYTQHIHITYTSHTHTPHIHTHTPHTLHTSHTVTHHKHTYHIYNTHKHTLHTHTTYTHSTNQTHTTHMQHIYTTHTADTHHTHNTHTQTYTLTKPRSGSKVLFCPCLSSFPSTKPACRTDDVCVVGSSGQAVRTHILCLLVCLWFAGLFRALSVTRCTTEVTLVSGISASPSVKWADWIHPKVSCNVRS